MLRAQRVDLKGTEWGGDGVEMENGGPHFFGRIVATMLSKTIKKRTKPIKMKYRKYELFPFERAIHPQVLSV